MYDYEFYEAVDTLVCKQLKRCAKTIVTTFLMLVVYLSTLPVRLYERIRDALLAEKRSEAEITERFENLKKSGHI